MSERGDGLEVSAVVGILYASEEVAEAILGAISPDNLRLPPGLNLSVERSGRELRIEVECTRGIRSMIATLDDLLSCAQAAERAIAGAKRF